MLFKLMQTVDTETVKIEQQIVDISIVKNSALNELVDDCLLYTSPSPRDRTRSRMPSSA